jgi:hypothetical protein
VLEQENNRTVILLTYEANGKNFEVTVAKTLVWGYEEHAREINRTASFIATEFTGVGISFKFYQLSYLVRHEEYKFGVFSILTPLDLETYNSSFTSIVYIPAGKSDVTTLEFVEFNSSVTLSQQYEVLGKVAQKIGKVYDKSEDETLTQFAERYYTMKKECKYLSKLVEKQLQEYNKPSEIISAILYDGFWECILCELAIGAALIIGCAAACFYYPIICPVCFAMLEYIELLHVSVWAACQAFGCEEWTWP